MMMAREMLVGVMMGLTMWTDDMGWFTGGCCGLKHTGIQRVYYNHGVVNNAGNDLVKELLPTFPLKEITGTTKRDLHLASLAFPISGFISEISLSFTLHDNKTTINTKHTYLSTS